MYNLIRNVLHQIFHFVIFTVAMNMNMKYFPDYKKRTRTFQNYFMSVSKFESLIILNSLAFEITYISLISSGFIKVEKKTDNRHFWCDPWKKNTIRKLCKILHKSNLQICWWWLFEVNNVWSRCFTYTFELATEISLTFGLQCVISWKKSTHLVLQTLPIHVSNHFLWYNILVRLETRGSEPEKIESKQKTKQKKNTKHTDACTNLYYLDLFYACIVLLSIKELQPIK